MEYFLNLWWWTSMIRKNGWGSVFLHLVGFTFPFSSWYASSNSLRFQYLMVLYNTNGFRTETMYDYYIVMKSMFLVVKLSSHSSIVYVNITILLPWTTHKQHQNYSKPKAFKNPKLPFSQTLYSWHNFGTKWRCPSRSQNTSLYTNQKETNQETS